MDVDISVFNPGDEVTYVTTGRSVRKITRTGKVKEISQGVKTCIVLNLGEYRDTIYEHDLKSGQIEILEIKKGEANVGNKIIRPDKDYLESIFNKANGNIKQAAQLCDPPVSDVTMGKWLKATGIIPQEGLRAIRAIQAPPADELRAAWEEASYVIHRLEVKYGVPHPTIKRWMEKAGLIAETPTGIQNTLPQTNKETQTEQEDSGCTASMADNGTPADDNNNNQAAADPVQDMENKNETLKKIIAFYQAPLQVRVEGLEAKAEIIGSLLKSFDKGATSRECKENTDLLDIAAELIIRVAARL